MVHLFCLQVTQLLKLSGYFCLPPGSWLNNSTFCPHSEIICFVWISEETAIISLYSINLLVCITETECFYCAVRTESLIIIHGNLRLYRGADKSLARPGRKQAQKHVTDARDFNNIEMRAVIKFFFLQGKAPKEIHGILTEKLSCFLPGRAKDLSAPL